MKKKKSVAPDADSIDLKGSDLRTRIGPLLLLTAMGRA